MADAISFDESFWVEEIDPTDPESLSSVSVDYTPAFNLGVCFKDNFEVYLKYLALLDPLEADLLILYYYCDKKVKEIAKILKTTPVKVSGLISQAEQRLALLLHINLLLTTSVLQEINKVITAEYDRVIFRTFLREVSRRRTSHVLGLTFHQVSSSIKRIVETLSKSELSLELRDLIKIISPSVASPRETRQLDPSERVCVFDVISCPQQVYAISTLANPKLSLGNFGDSSTSLLQEFSELANQASYFSVNQAILAHQLGDSSVDLWDYLVPSFISRLISADQFAYVTLTESVEIPINPAKTVVSIVKKSPPQKARKITVSRHSKEVSAVV